MDSSPAKSPHSKASLMSLLDELIADILSRLPIKTLMQIKCVCKSWKTLISFDPSFAKLHLQRSPRNNQLLLIAEWGMPDQRLDLSVVPFPVSRLLETPIEFRHPYYRLKDVTIPNDPYYRLKNMDCSEIVGSCNGLICLGTICQNTRFRIWNPATNTLSEKLGFVTDFSWFIFGYDISTDTYKVVAFSSNKVKVFSFSDNVWRDIQSFPIVPFGLHPRQHHFHQYNSNHGVYVSGTINWLAIRNKVEYDEWNDITVDQFVIVSLDLATETYRQLLPPSGFVEVPPVEPSVTVLMDCLCFSHRFKDTHFVLWKMMEFGVQESWTQFLKISFQDLRIDYGISNLLAYRSQLFLLPLCVSESSNTLIMASNQEDYVAHFYGPQHAIVYNWRDNIVEQFTSNDEIMWFDTKDYVESLVSTCQNTTPSTSSTSGVIHDFVANERLVAEVHGIRVEVGACEWSLSVFGARNRAVSQKQIEKAVRRVMEDGGGSMIRKRAKEMPEKACKSVQEGRSSYHNLTNLAQAD
ncbi:hypothetical protein TSUD_175470 [Trifolium subterraneum]|uniref:F-box domain-containing protein n=1 Tax=Trifolium subterraneum TaxID=3900 RepID=A0A2Z6NMK9_TRISU|nr:hypothetical protein TSUD_175470 [Trifolium subterraneum]